MKPSDKTAPEHGARRDLFNELTEGMAALSLLRGQGLRPGVNLDDSAALLELMESDRDSDLLLSDL
ncbi:MAG TPA: hypothetical protein VNN25_14835 [Thermoanaerobaculia bacterium]|nr:hypothetical protein [Thermoanaerobaculia bacterium]